MGKRIIVTGMFGCGSSAVWDLLSEYCSNQTGLPDERAYEQNIFYTPGGLFDLADKLLIGNDLHRSDEALKLFYREMKKLNDNDFGWFGSYKALFGNQFMELVEHFMNELKIYKVKGRYYGQYTGVRFSALKLILQIGAKLLQNRKIYKWGRQYQFIDKKEEMLLAFPDEEEFYKAAQKFVKSYLELFGTIENGNIIYDRLLLPHNLWRVPLYFDSDIRIIYVKRDVRDLYILNKYIWPRLHAGVMYPNELGEFCSFWTGCRKAERRIEDERILTLHFEELVYSYDVCVKKIENFCGLSPMDHTEMKKYFDPDKSRMNTQTFLLKEEWEREAELIEKRFKEEVFAFPVRERPELSLMFDDSRE